jgi:hypothetical protein
MTAATLVRVTTNITVGPSGERAWSLWIVVGDDPKAAEQIVRRAVSPGCIVEATNIEVGPETVKRLGLAPGQAWHL